MKLVLKIMAFYIGLVVCNIFLIFQLDKYNMLGRSQVIGVFIEFSLLAFIELFAKVIIPIAKLYRCLNIIDFNNDIIDCSKLDYITESGFKEIKLITHKFKYLIDVIAERINRINLYTYKSEHDELSGLYNRTHLEKVKGNYEMQSTFNIIFIDVNNLKRMNDEFGHEAGDLLIRSTAKALNYWDSYGDVYRVGGDEFMVVIVNKSPERVKNMILQWYPTVGLLNKDSDGFKCVLSYGFASGVRNDDFNLVQKAADDRMYKMKIAIKKKFGEPLR